MNVYYAIYKNDEFVAFVNIVSELKKQQNRRIYMELKVRCSYPQKDFIPDFYQTKIVEAKYVTDGLRNEIKNWIPADPILIDAPTGKGKNTLILEECIPRAIQAKRNVLIVSNRVALSVQQKRAVMKTTKSPMNDRLTDKGVLETETFGNVKIITYHRLRTLFEDKDNEEWLRKVMFVILDEAHFFIADSLFNEYCGYYLEQIVWRFSNAIRIYLTATSWDVLYPIAEAEKNKFHQFVKPNYWQPPRKCLRYYFPRDFSNYKLNFISSIDDIPFLIESSQNTKWLIFIDNKEKGRKLANEIGNKCAYLDSESKGNEVWKQITENQKFNKQILVTTSVLDNGVSIVDDGLKNIVVFTDSRTSIIRMIGRKRCKENEIVNLWVCDVPFDKAQHYYQEYLKLYEWYKRFDNCHDELDRHRLASKIWSADNPKLRKLFGIGRGKLFENKMARFSVERKIVFYKNIIEGKTTFQNSVQEWLGKPIEQPSRYVDKLIDFCNEHLGNHLSENECKKLRFLIVKSYEEAGNKEPQKSRLSDLKERALNTRLAAIGIDFKIVSTNQQWILCKSSEEVL